jgi:hypothetical protein
MRAFLRIFIALAWSLWFGGIIGLFISVSTLFRSDREIAIVAAPQLFHAFEEYQLVLAALSLLATFAWRLLFNSRQVVHSFTLFALATVAAVFETTMIAPRIDAMRVAGQTHTPAFARAHGMSMIVYVGEATVLLIAGVCVLTTKTRKREDGNSNDEIRNSNQCSNRSPTE